MGQAKRGRTYSILLAGIISAVSIICVSIFWIVVFLVVLRNKWCQQETRPVVEDTGTIPPGVSCPRDCEFHLVETIPENLTYDPEPQFPSTTETWKKLIDSAESTIDIASYYWTLLPQDSGSYRGETTQDGTDIYNGLVAAAKKGVNLRIVQNAQENAETASLENNGWAQVRSLNFSNWFPGGVLHTKFWIVDKKHLYLGSANLDWRALTQVKELGAAIYNCSCLANDLSKLMEVYWEMGAPNKRLPASWPNSLGTRYNSSNPMLTTLNGEQSAVYVSSSPPAFCPRGRMDDLKAILRVIHTAQKFVHISVMDYFPTTLYLKNNRYWPVIDDALRSAAYSGIEVKLLVSKWNHTRSSMFAFLNSLEVINSTLPCKRVFDSKLRKSKCLLGSNGTIEVRIFQVPVVGTQAQIPYARVNHAKYMVTDNTAYIGTSNWSADYFISTAGAGIIIQRDDTMLSSEIVQNLNEKIFMRDWNSPYASPLSDFDISGKQIKS